MVETQPGTHYEDFSVGQTFEYGSYTFETEEIEAFAEQYDPQRFHVDEAAARESIFGGLIASGWHTASVCMKLLVEGLLGDIASVGGRGVDDLRWHRPVTPETELSVEVELVEKQPSDLFPGVGELHAEVTGVNESGEPVISFTLLGLIERRDPA